MPRSLTSASSVVRLECRPRSESCPHTSTLSLPTKHTVPLSKHLVHAHTPCTFAPENQMSHSNAF